MKILIMSHSLSGGGAERVGVSWANGLSKLSDEIFMYSDYHKDVTYTLDKRVKRIEATHWPKGMNFFNKIKKFISSFFNVGKCIYKTRPDAIVIVAYYLAVQAWIFAKIYKIPIILTDHNSFERPDDMPMSRKMRFQKQYISRLGDALTVLTIPDKTICEQRGLKNVYVLHNPLFLKPVRSVPIKERIVLSVGRMDAWRTKGFDLLLNAWSEIHNQFPDWKLRLVGHASEKSKRYLNSLIEPNSRVEFVEYTPNVVDEYQKASIYVLASRCEGWGLVMIEAMSQGCAVIASNYKGRQAEAIDNGKNGLLCEVNNMNDIKDKLITLMTDNTARSNMQATAISNLEQYSEINVANDLKKIIIQCINGKNN